MKNCIFQIRIQKYILLVFIGITFLSSITNPCFSQINANEAGTNTIIQQADQALAAKDYAGALYLYNKASLAKPGDKYTSVKINDINSILDASPDSKDKLIEDIILKAESLFNQKDYPNSKSEFQKALLLDPSAQFPKDRLAQISAVYSDPDDLVIFNDAIANGDKALAALDFDKAISSYEKALEVKPNTNSVKVKITSAKKQQAEYQSRIVQASKYIASADQLLKTEKYTEARAEYQKALNLTPDNHYAKQKIQEIDNYELNKKALQESYDKSIEQADQFYISRDFTNARTKYQEALKAKPQARYPKEMIEKSKTGESELQSDQQKYDAALAGAESFYTTSDYEAALLGFKSALAIKPFENYPQTKITELEKLLAENTSRKEAYANAIKNGDQSLDEKQYDVALIHYHNALSLLPGEKYPSKKIEEITAITVKQKEKDDNYSKSIAEADKLFNKDKFTDAIPAYTKALVIKPEETYPQQKITEAQAKLAASKSKEDEYKNAIVNGDRLLAESKYVEALEAYELSHNLRPFEEYPISKISEINFVINKYTKSVEKGNKALSSGNSELAIKSFQDALNVIPTAQYPQDKITEIKAAVQSQQKTDEGYATAIKAGDQQLTAKDYSHALESYAEATNLKKDEKYPQEQIAKINKILGDLRSIDENYSQAISDGDNNFSSQKLNEAIIAYKNAATIKPAETYPKSQIEKISGLIATQTKLDSDYLAFISSADKLFNSQKFEDAILDFRKAQSLKPSEKYPSEKITEAEKQIASIKAIQESYNKAIADGDKFFTEKDYLNSLASFKSANAVKPDEAYPSQKITEIQTILDNDKAESQRYNEAIAQADIFYADKKYTEAIESYKRASVIKPLEKYPQDQVVVINQALAKQKKLDEDYQKLINEAATQLNTGKYDEARRLYTDAGILKPSEKLPKDIIAEIEGILADLKNKDESFTKHIADGDAYFEEKKFTEALIEYKNASAVKPAETYPKSQVEKINLLIAKQQKLDDNYLTTLAYADQFFELKKYTEAIVDYRKALALKPTEKYPADQIAATEKLLAELKALQETYDKSIADGDKKLAASDYESALIAFTSANTAKPAEAYPKQKIAEIQAVLDTQKAENAKYQEALALADKFFTAGKYLDALEPYQRASTIKPSEKYPQEQIIRINNLISEQKKLDVEYQKLIADADIQFKATKYDEAISLYTKAGTLKPTEKLPIDKIAEINRILADLKLRDENYSKALNTAAEFYSAKNLSVAIKSYEEALAFKPDEKYPRERITAITAEMKAIDENYSKAIVLGDSKLASNNLMDAMNAYQDALEIKPNEAYPKTKIAEINSALLAQKEEMEKMYVTYIADGDRFFGTKEYSVAISAFTKASGIKPNETYPKQRITEINKIVEEIELARRAEYNKALGEADKLYNTKVFDLAIDAYEAAAKINPDDSYPAQQISKIRKYMSEHAIQDLYSQALVINEGSEKKFDFSAIEPRLRRNNYILLKARSTGKTAPKVYLNYGKDNTKNGGIVLRSLDSSTISDYLIRISVQDKWYREDNNWISLSVETGDIEITKVQIAAGDE
jgi:tetratricopeptide (TPR) repeat protein